ncbi:radical SAM family heme chaperone HemW [soil metagenome]
MPFPSPQPDFEKIASAVGSAPRVAYGPPHIYPVSAPAFVTQPKAERERPSSPRLYLYVHIPFCNYACNFCFYAKRIGAHVSQKQRYVSALLKELSWITPGTQLGELFVGGGTPTALPPDLLDEVLAGIMSRMHDGGKEIHTVEATPDTITDEHLDVLRKNGVRRVSMGVQSLHENVLETVRRRHTSNDVLAACEKVSAAGFALNVDLIYGLPGYSEEMFRSDFEAVAASGIRSVTVYNLRINRNTPVSNAIRDDERLDLDRLVRWRAFIAATAEKLGFVQTRWHTFERVSGTGPRYRRAPSASDSGGGHQFGAGMSARSHLGNTFYRNHENLETYVERIEADESPVEHMLVLDESDRKAHYVARTLGDGRALDTAEYARAFGIRFEDEFAEPLQRFMNGDLVTLDGDAINLTNSGKLVYDLITEAFYPQHAQEWLAQRQNSLRKAPAAREIPN